MRAPPLALALALAFAGCASAPTPKDLALDAARALPFPEGGREVHATTATAYGMPGAQVTLEYPTGSNATTLLDDLTARLRAAGANVTGTMVNATGGPGGAIQGNVPGFGLACEAFPWGEGAARVRCALVASGKA